MEELDKEYGEFTMGEIPEETQPDAILDADGNFKKYDVTPVYRKEDLLDKEVEFVLRGVKVSKFGKPVLIVEGEDAQTEYMLNISKTTFNKLYEVFGNNQKNWVGRSVLFRGYKFDKVQKNRKTGEEEHLSGIELKIVATK